MPKPQDSSPGPVIVWFRDDLRLSDHPALLSAIDTGRPVICLFVLDDSGAARPLGEAARWWLAGSLRALEGALGKRGNALVLRRGPALQVVPAIAAETGAVGVYWNRRYEGGAVPIDEAIATALRQRGVAVETCQASLLFEPGDILNKSGLPFGVFGAFWRTARSRDEPRAPLPAPQKVAKGARLRSETIEDWRLEPTKPDWAAEMRQTWTRGEEAGQRRLSSFLAEQIDDYATLRDFPARDATSRLSPHLRFGEVSPFQVWAAARTASEMRRRSGRSTADVEKFQAEMGWREFAYHLLYHHPEMATRNLQGKFDRFPWREDPAAVAAWRRGRTGYPVVDAAMRQLWRIGWMHNRMRMVTASFLCKHLLIDWRIGEQWFWDTLVDADPANNPMSWQWVAGAGADPAPFFRIFNPVLQGQRYDPDGDYVRRFVPELAGVPSKLIHTPWKPVSAKHAGAVQKYPKPIVDHAAARTRALAAFAKTTPRSGE